MFICDECREETKFDAKTKDGRQLCATCLKKVIADSKGLKTGVSLTKDPFVKLVRKFVRKDIFYSEDIMLRGKKGEGRCFTDARMLISEMSKRPDVYRLMSVRTLRIRQAGGEAYPNIEHVIPEGKPDFKVSIPKDFYMYAKAFKIPGGYLRDSIRADITEDGITVEQRDCDDMALIYGEADTSGVTRRIRVDLRYLMALKPKVLEVHKKSYRVRGSYDKLVDAFPVVVLAGMKTD